MDNYLDDSYPGVKYPNKRKEEQLTLKRNKSESDNMKLLWRYVLAWMGCLGIMNVYFCRINLSVAMVAMVGVEQVPADNVTETSSTCKAR